IMRKEEIAKSDLPQKVVTKINTEFNSYRVDDVKKITEDTKIVYTVELKKITEEWKVTFDVEGNVINKVAD
ncbi:MAG: PepSY-like domain-containing protein, partial [Bacteroidia bacterium]|nr:PepSY-like domain-containing protein [Bacteroidia bacterium]